MYTILCIYGLENVSSISVLIRTGQQRGTLVEQRRLFFKILSDFINYFIHAELRSLIQHID